jgi:type VI secretion system secreted protein VgrG
MASPPAMKLLRASVASGDSIDVRHFTVREGMSQLFEIQLSVVSSNPDIDLDAIVARAASFTVQVGLEPAQTRTWVGVATSFQQVAAEDTGVSTYQMKISPVLWLLTQRRNHRIFQLKSEIEIARKLLSEWNVPFVERLSDTYKKRKYRVQYGESDYLFLRRMLEDAGISFFFETEGDETRLVLHDAPQRSEARAPLSFKDTLQDGDVEHITNVRVGRRVRPGKYTVQDQDYRRPPAFKLLSSAKNGIPNEESLERYHYVPGGFLFQSEKGDSTPNADDKGKYRADEGEGQKLATRRLDAKRAVAKIISFDTNAPDLAPGIVMSALDHPKSELSPGKKLLVTDSQWQGAPTGEWRKSCEATSADADYRPALRTRKPRVSGVETATVVGPPGETIHTDEFGRVQFHWDREGKSDDASSCWIPVNHPWAGGGFGVVNLPRVGHEVIVDFLGGDPDRPIVLGRVYTNVQKVPYTLPAHKTQSGWKSQTVGGTGYNEIMFEDAPGRELVRMQAEKDLNKLVKNNESVTIGNNRSKQVGNDDALTVGNDRTRTVGNNESVMIGNSQSLTVGVNQSITVCADQTITLPSGNQTESITGNRAFTLTGNLTETITGNSTLTQVGNQSETVNGSSSRMQIGNQSVMLIGDKTHLELGAQTEILLGNRTFLEVGNQLDLQLGGRKDIQIGSRLDVQIGGTTRLEIGTLNESVIGTRTEGTSAAATENVGALKQVNAASYELHTGPATITSGPFTVTAGPVTINGAAMNVIGTGVVTIKGSIIKLNC